MRQLVKKKKEKEIDDKLVALIEKYADLKKGIAHNKFGCVCLTANMLEKCEQHFENAEKLVSKYVQFSNIYMNWGNYYGQKRDYKKAIEYYQKTLEMSPFIK